MQANKPEILEDLEKVWNFIKSLGDTYYGRQFITPLNQRICSYQDPEAPISEKKFSDIPTNAGGWVEDGVSILGLSDPELGLFREDDGRIVCFALFNTDGENPDKDKSDAGEQDPPPPNFDGYIGDGNPPNPNGPIIA
jgi:hypothetical protein